MPYPVTRLMILLIGYLLPVAVTGVLVDSAVQSSIAQYSLFVSRMEIRGPKDNHTGESAILIARIAWTDHCTAANWR